MTTYKHIVQVHPVENGEVNLSKVEHEAEFDTKEEAEGYVEKLNGLGRPNVYQAVYLGRVNCATGELE